MKKHLAVLLVLALCLALAPAAFAGSSAPSESPYTLRSDPNGKNDANIGEMSVLGSKQYRRKDIAGIVFEKDTSGMTGTVWDVSKKTKGAVMAWVDDGMILHIGPSAGGVTCLPPSCKTQFAGYTNATFIDFGTNVSTEQVTDMSSMFEGCSGLTGLDVSGFVTDKASDMSAMFRGCTALTDLDTSSFNMKNVKKTEAMFEGVPGK